MTEGASAPLSLASIEERYRPVFVVGEGGMGVVEAALDRDADGRTRMVALKRVPLRASSDRRVRAMFLREASLAVLLRHPNVVHAFDYGEAGGELFISMELVEGVTLA